MAGTPGSGSNFAWPPYPSPSTQGGESQRTQLEAALRVLREQRAQIAAEVGEYLYSLVLQGQLRDPVVLATCRRLYDHEQQLVQLEANLRAIPAAPINIAPPSDLVPSYDAGGPPGVPPAFPSSGSMEDAATIVQHGPPGSRDVPPVDRRPADLDLDSGETLIAPVRRPEPVAPGAAKPAELRTPSPGSHLPRLWYAAFVEMAGSLHRLRSRCIRRRRGVSFRE
ncbi:MAG: hypothetical protein LC748_07015 [Thermomicrobia bacterium]|nr:hypothetical protein [Thermomicrobia bacterium]